MVWSILVAIVLSCFLIHFEGKAIREYHADIYYNKMFIAKAYTRRVISDVYVAVMNNIYYIEQTLNNPDIHKETMARIVKNGTRIRSCGISFIADYYPQKGHNFCPFAWRSAAKPGLVYSEDLGDAALDYLKTDWFHNYVKSDSAQWTEPFYGGHNFNSPTAAYMTPIHDKDGRVVAMVGADLSLDWFTNMLNTTDSLINNGAIFPTSRFEIKSNSFIINHDGRFITHPDGSYIMKENFFHQLEACDGSDVKGLINRIKSGIESNNGYERFMVNGEKCYLFYTPVEFTKWTLVSVVPCQNIDLASYLNCVPLCLILILAILLIALISYHYMKFGMEPLNQLICVTRDMSKGEFGTPVPEVEHHDEISQLCDSIEKMKYSLSDYSDNMKRTK